MRAVEREPWAKSKSRRHDVMCLAIAEGKERAFPNYRGEVTAVVEAPAGPGFIDVLVSTVGPREEIERAIVEVKTRSEDASAGDIIRQMKFYRRYIENVTRMILVVENEPDMPDTAFRLLAHEGIEVLPAWYFEGKHVA